MTITNETYSSTDQLLSAINQKIGALREQIGGSFQFFYSLTSQVVLKTAKKQALESLRDLLVNESSNIEGLEIAIRNLVSELYDQRDYRHDGETESLFQAAIAFYRDEADRLLRESLKSDTSVVIVPAYDRRTVGQTDEDIRRSESGLPPPSPTHLSEIDSSTIRGQEGLFQVNQQDLRGSYRNGDDHQPRKKLTFKEWKAERSKNRGENFDWDILDKGRPVSTLIALVAIPLPLAVVPNKIF